MEIKKSNNDLSKNIGQGLKTLGDYRKTARDTLFSRFLPVHGHIIKESTSVYDAVTVALANIRNLIIESRLNKSDLEIWGAIFFPQTEYAMNNYSLLHCVKLMELAIYYNNHQNKEKVFQGWIE